MKDLIKKKLRSFLGINSDIREIKKDVLACMEKQMLFQEQYPLHDPEALRPEIPSSNMYEYVAESLLDDQSVRESGNGYGWYVLWEDGFAGPFETFDESRDYIRDNLRISKPRVVRLYRCDLRKRA